MEIQEEFISGFCRTCNGTQTVCCEYTEENGEKYLEFMDCAHAKCLHRGACGIYKEAIAIGRERPLCREKS